MSATTSADPRLASHQVPSSPTTPNAANSLPKSQPPLPNISPYPTNTAHSFHVHPPNNRPNGSYTINGSHNPRNSIITSNGTSQPLPQQGMLYPVVSSGRGFVHWPPSRPSDPEFYHRASVGGPYSLVDPGVPQLHQLSYRGQQYSQSSNLVSHPPQAPCPKAHPIAANDTASANPRRTAQGIPPTQGSDDHGFNDYIEGPKEETIATVRGRKVRIVDGASLYSLCRSWLRNGQDEEIQSKIDSNTKALPKPLPLSMVEDQFPSKKDVDDEEVEDEASVADLSSQDLLKNHIQRAKRVRARFREDRNKRIARYKTRLSLLLPSQDLLKGDASSGE